MFLNDPFYSTLCIPISSKKGETVSVRGSGMG